MDYMYGELNDLVKNINYSGITTNTAIVTVDNIARTIKVDVTQAGGLENYYTKPEIDNMVFDINQNIEGLDVRVGNLEKEVSVYNYFYSEGDEDECTVVYLPLHETDYTLRSISTKGLEVATPLTIITNENMFVFVKEYGETHHHDVPLFSEEHPFDINLYQTGNKADMTTAYYAYDSIDLIHNLVNRYCYAIKVADLADAFSSTQWQWTGTSANGRLYISHSLMSDAFDVETIGWSTNKWIMSRGLTCRSISSSNWGIENLKSISGVTNKATALSALKGENFADTYIIFKRKTPITETFEGVVEVPVIHCDGINYTGIGNYSGYFLCLQASYMSLEDLTYSKDQADAKFATKEELNTCEHIVKIGDPDTNEIEANTDLYTVTLKDLGYPKYACAVCVAPTPVEAEEGEELAETPVELPFRSYTFFINQRKELPTTPVTYEYGYLVFSQGKEYWMTKTGATEITGGTGVKVVNLDGWVVENINVNKELEVGDIVYFDEGEDPIETAIVTQISWENNELYHVRLSSLTSPGYYFEWDEMLGSMDDPIEFGLEDYISTVEANPTLSGGESTLSSIQINSTRYVIPSPENTFGIFTITGEGTNQVSISFNRKKVMLTDLVVNCVNMGGVTIFRPDTKKWSDGFLGTWVQYSSTPDLDYTKYGSDANNITVNYSNVNDVITFTITSSTAGVKFTVDYIFYLMQYCGY